MESLVKQERGWMLASGKEEVHVGFDRRVSEEKANEGKCARKKMGQQATDKISSSQHQQKTDTKGANG